MIRTIAEIGLNHNGCLGTAKALQVAAAEAGCWAVKYQIRTNFRECSPAHLWETTRQWQGKAVSYFEYRAALEFNDCQLRELYDHAQSLGLQWFASCWDVASVGRLARISRDLIKVASAGVTNRPLLEAIAREKFETVFLSTGMSDQSEVDTAKRMLWDDSKVILMACTSVYPCPKHLCNLSRINTLDYRYANRVVGYSGHEPDLLPSLYAAVLGATYIERHLTYDKNAEGSDHKSSLEPHEMRELCARLADIPILLGSPEIEPLPEEAASIKRLRVALPINTDHGLTDQTVLMDAGVTT